MNYAIGVRFNATIKLLKIEEGKMERGRGEEEKRWKEGKMEVWKEMKKENYRKRGLERMKMEREERLDTTLRRLECPNQSIFQNEIKSENASKYFYGKPFQPQLLKWPCLIRNHHLYLEQQQQSDLFLKQAKNKSKEIINELSSSKRITVIILIF